MSRCAAPAALAPGAAGGSSPEQQGAGRQIALMAERARESYFVAPPPAHRRADLAFACEEPRLAFWLRKGKPPPIPWLLHFAAPAGLSLASARAIPAPFFGSGAAARGPFVRVSDEKLGHCASFGTCLLPPSVNCVLLDDRQRDKPLAGPPTCSQGHAVVPPPHQWTRVCVCV